MQPRVAGLVGGNLGVQVQEVKEVVVEPEERVAVVQEAAVGVAEVEVAVAKAGAVEAVAAEEKAKDAACKAFLGEEMLTEALHGMIALTSHSLMNQMRMLKSRIKCSNTHGR